MNASKRILFVDDDPSILAGLQNLLYRDRGRWTMVFALGGQRGLDEIRKAPFDVVVSDMRMPEVDGATLLNAIKDECPATVRTMLSGYADREALVRLLPTLHQFLVKPCNAATLRGVLERSLDGVNVDRDAQIRKIVAGVDKLPTPPDVFFDLSRLMQSATASVSDVAEVIARDPGLSAKLLQLVNCAYFGAGRVTTSIHQAVALLGTEQLRYIALTTSVFSAPEAEVSTGFSLKNTQQASIRVANLARAFAKPEDRDQAFASALLHQIGHIVLAQFRSGDLQACSERVRLGDKLLDAEIDVFGATHSDVGARLLAIWGIPTAIVDVVQFYCDPGGAPESSRLLASIVHVAAATVGQPWMRAEIDIPSLKRAGCDALLAGWRTIAQCTVNLNTP